MSILNRPSAGLPSVLIVLFKCVLEHGPLARSRLLSLCGPPSATEVADQMPQKTLTTWKKLGLFKVGDDDTVRLSADLPPAALEPAAGFAQLSRALREVVFRPENNSNFWSRDDDAEAEALSATSGVRAADFTRGVCWCLALRSRLPRAKAVTTMWKNGVDALQQQTLEPGCSAFGNDVRWVGFAAWAPFLGFGWSSVSQALVVDPTQAIREEFPAVFKDEPRLTQRQFFGRLVDRLPVLDGGPYRQQVEAKLVAGRWERPADGVLSESLSAALERLSAAGVLELEDRADTERKALTGPGGRQTRTFSHVILRGAAS
jgi:hypothetical protein